MKYLDLPAWRAAWWAWREIRRLKRSLPKERIDSITVSRPPNLPNHAGRGVAAVLRRVEHTCLVKALLLQKWHESHGNPSDVIIAVTSPSAGFRAHAWLDGDPPCHDEGFEELMRRRPA